MTLHDIELAIHDCKLCGSKTFVLAFPPRAGWDLTVGAYNIFAQGIGGNVLEVKPPLVYLEVNTEKAKIWLRHVKVAMRHAIH